MNFTDLEKKIITAILQEKTNSEIAKEFNLSQRGIEEKIKKLSKKYGVKGRIGLVREFLRIVS